MISKEMPLGDVRVLDLTQVLAGPFATRTLADLGAEVIKVEPPGAGDAARRFTAVTLNGESFYFLGMNRNKKSMTLNLKHPQGRKAFYALARKSDVVVSNFRPGVTASLGVDYPTLREVNPRIICCSISGFGPTGPERDRPAFDPIVSAASGLISVTGEPGGHPMLSGFPFADLCSGYAAVMGVLAALYHRNRTGLGQEIDISMFDVMVHLSGHVGQYYLATGEMLEPLGPYQPINVPAGVFKTRDSYIMISCTTQKFWENLAGVLARGEGSGALAQDPRFATPPGRFTHRKELLEILEPVFQRKTTDEWLALLEAAEVPCSRINNVAEALKSPTAQHRNLVVEMEHPVAGQYRATGNPIKMSGISQEVFFGAPLLGQHTEGVLSDLLGYSREEMEALRREGAI